jgi:hypothetical protein
MSTQNAIFNGDQYVSDNGQEREQTLQEEAAGKHINELGTGKSNNPADRPHHRTCCCASCWPKNINSYL